MEILAPLCRPMSTSRNVEGFVELERNSIEACSGGRVRRQRVYSVQSRGLSDTYVSGSIINQRNIYRLREICKVFYLEFIINTYTFVELRAHVNIYTCCSSKYVHLTTAKT